jgi:drug/metabolite transporter (DMT)-like permease
MCITQYLPLGGAVIILAMASRPLAEAAARQHEHVALCAGWLFLAIALVTLVMAIHPEWRTKIRWGSKRSSIPMSGLGRTAGIVLFLVWSLVCFAEGLGYVESGASISGVSLLVAFVFFLSGLWHDQRRPRR